MQAKSQQATQALVFDWYPLYKTEGYGNQSQERY
jgi:hypothetical protein